MSQDQARLQLIISGDSQGAQRALNGLGQGLRGTQSMVRGVATTMRTLAVGLISGAVARGVQSIANGAMQAAMEVDKLQRITGLSTQRASELRAGAQLLGVEFGTLEGAIQGMLNNMKSLNSADNPFRLLGISVVNGKGQMRDFGEILDDTLGKLQRMGQTGARTMFAQRVFGGAAPELLKMIDAGGEGLKKAAEAARSMGLILTPQQIEQAQRYRVAVRQMGQAWEGVKIQLSNQLMPWLTRLAQNVTQGAQNWLPRFQQAIGPVAQGFRLLWSTISSVFGVVGALFRAFLDTAAASQRLQNMAKGLREVFARLGNTLKEFSEWLSRLKARIQQGDVAGAIGEMWEKAKAAVKRGTEVAKEFLSETLPEWGKSLSKWLSGVGDMLLDPQTLKGISAAGATFGHWLGEMLVNVVLGLAEFAIKATPGLIKFMVGVFVGALDGLASFALGFGAGIVDAIVQALGFEPVDWDGIRQSLSDWWAEQKPWFSNMGQGIAKTVSQWWRWSARAWDWISQSLSEWWAEKQPAVAEVSREIAQEAAQGWNWTAGHWSRIMDSLNEWWGEQQAAAAELGRVIAGVIAAGWTWSKEQWSQIATSLSEWWEATQAEIVQQGLAIADTLSRTWHWTQEHWDSIRQSLSDWWASAKAFVAGVGSNLAKSLLAPLVSEANSAIAAFNRLIDVINSLPAVEIPTLPELPVPGQNQPVGATGSGSLGTPSPAPASGPAQPASSSQSKAYSPMADGGVWMPRAGGHNINVKVAEAGKPEGFMPLDPAVFRRLGLTGGSGPIHLTSIVQLDGREVGRFTRQFLLDDLKMQKQLAF